MDIPGLMANRLEDKTNAISRKKQLKLPIYPVFPLPINDNFTHEMQSFGPFKNDKVSRGMVHFYTQLKV